MAETSWQDRFLVFLEALFELPNDLLPERETRIRKLDDDSPKCIADVVWVRMALDIRVSEC